MADRSTTPRRGRRDREESEGGPPEPPSRGRRGRASRTLPPPATSARQHSWPREVETSFESADIIGSSGIMAVSDHTNAPQHYFLSADNSVTSLSGGQSGMAQQGAAASSGSNVLPIQDDPAILRNAQIMAQNDNLNRDLKIFLYESDKISLN